MSIERIKSINNCELCDKKPCTFACPLNNNIKEAITFVKEEKYEEAYNVFADTTVLLSICGRICPFNKQCEGGCIKRHSRRKVKIGRIEAFLGDLALENNWQTEVPQKTKYSVAVIGSGPAGLTCAAFLRKMGIGVTIYEKHNYLGGLLMHGIPDFRLSKDTVAKVIHVVSKVSFVDENLDVELAFN